ncbi:hypothetical protein ACQCVK_14090 [Rossellomorea vietnamensis]|uniref:hypothetical protein n=1 Tax=Rossellomorea vietnamensis TaxID=218284 RepID=UPI003CEA8AC3
MSYTLMGTANYRVSMKKTPTRSENILYEVGLGEFPLVFPLLQRGLRGTAFAKIGLFLAAIPLTTYRYYWKDKAAGPMMIPFVLRADYITRQRNK